jgi:hypothetical protein
LVCWSNGLSAFFNALFQFGYVFVLPNGFAHRLSDPENRTAEIETSADGVRVVIGRNAAFLNWKLYKHIWIYPDFVILTMSPFLLRFIIIPAAGMTSEVRRDLEAASQGNPIT